MKFLFVYDRHERDLNQTIRQQQDEAYLESLKADQEKERRKQEEQRKREQQEREMHEMELQEIQRKEVGNYTAATWSLFLKKSLISVKVPKFVLFVENFRKKVA